MKQNHLAYAHFVCVFSNLCDLKNLTDFLKIETEGFSI